MCFTAIQNGRGENSYISGTVERNLIICVGRDGTRTLQVTA